MGQSFSTLDDGRHDRILPYSRGLSERPASSQRAAEVSLVFGQLQTGKGFEPGQFRRERAMTYGSILGWMNIHLTPISMFSRGTGF